MKKQKVMVVGIARKQGRIFEVEVIYNKTLKEAEDIANEINNAGHGFQYEAIDVSGKIAEVMGFFMAQKRSSLIEEAKSDEREFIKFFNIDVHKPNKNKE